jgi:uncharacterized protein YqeY
MSLSIQIMDEIKAAMRAKDTVALESLRAIKAEILLAQTSGSKESLQQTKLNCFKLVKTARIALKFSQSKIV